MLAAAAADGEIGAGSGNADAAGGDIGAALGKALDEGEVSDIVGNVPVVWGDRADGDDAKSELF